MDLRMAEVNLRRIGSEKYAPSMMTAKLIYCYAHGLKSNQQGVSTHNMAIKLFIEELSQSVACLIVPIPNSYFHPIPSRNSESKRDGLLEVEILFVSPKFYLESPGPAILMSEVPVGIGGGVDVNDGPWILFTRFTQGGRIQDSVNKYMSYVYALGPEFAGERIREAADGKLGAAESKASLLPSNARGCSGEDNATVPLLQHRFNCMPAAEEGAHRTDSPGALKSFRTEA